MRAKTLLLVFSLAAVIAVIALAASLHDVEFLPGRPLGSSVGEASPLTLPTLEIPSETPVWKILLFWALAVINIVLFFWLLPPEVRKRLLRQVLGFAVGVLALILALRYKLIQLPEIGGEPAQAAGPVGATAGGISEPMTFQPPQMSPWMIYLASFVALAIFVVIITLVYRRWFGSPIGGAYSLKSIAGIAQDSLRDLAAGRDWGDVIIETYVRMSQAVSSRRGLRREDSATPREFADRLTHAGLPADAVDRLTRMFESVRYGSHPSSEADVRAAADCLSAILQACGATS